MYATLTCSLFGNTLCFFNFCVVSLSLWTFSLRRLWNKIRLFNLEWQVTTTTTTTTTQKTNKKQTIFAAVASCFFWGKGKDWISRWTNSYLTFGILRCQKKTGKTAGAKPSGKPSKGAGGWPAKWLGKERRGSCRLLKLESFESLVSCF